MAAKKVVLAEDEQHIALLVRFTLEAVGFEVEHYPDGTTALARLESGPPPDAVVLDMMMPGVSGLDVLSRAKADPRYESIPFLIVSARARDVDRATALASGAAAYVTKPFNTEDLSALVVSLTQAAPPQPRGPDAPN